MAISFLDFFGSDLSKIDQTRKFSKQTSRILEFKPEGLDFLYLLRATTGLLLIIKILGNMKNGAEDIKRHRWFKNIDWEDVFYKKIKPPIVPNVSYDGKK